MLHGGGGCLKSPGEEKEGRAGCPIQGPMSAHCSGEEKLLNGPLQVIDDWAGCRGRIQP